MMVRLIPWVVGLVLTLGLPAASQAQWGYGWGGYPYHASTAFEGAARGMADVVRSQGQWELMNSMAAQNYAAARSQEIDNRYKWTKTYFDIRAYNRTARAQARGSRPTEEQLIRFAQAGRPDLLAPDQYDRYTGSIAWPSLLTQASFDESRVAVNEVLARRALHDGAMSGDDYLLVHTGVDQMLETLKGMVSQVDPKTYVSTKRFLESLAYDMR